MGNIQGCRYWKLCSPPGEISANVIWEKYKKCAEKWDKMREEKEGRRKLRGNWK
jgi:hypothetical protein